MPTSIDLQRAVVEIMVELDRNPAAAYTLLPGHAIKRLPLSYTERAETNLAKANSARKKHQADRKIRIEATIRGIKSDHPKFDSYQIANELNRVGEKPLRGDTWTARAVVRLLRVPQ